MSSKPKTTQQTQAKTASNVDDSHHDPVVMAKNKKILTSLFLFFLSGFVILYYLAPAITAEEKKILFSKIPKKGEDIRAIHAIVSRYYKQNGTYVYVLFCYLYVFLQSFGIPGPIILSLLSGALFGAVPGFITVCFCATLGASCCYTLSNLLGKGLVVKYFPDLIKKFSGMVAHNKGNLFWYMLFLRITPLIPNWFVNMGSPIVGIPLPIFFIGTFFGLMPANIIHIKTGLTLSELNEVGLNLNALLGLLVLGFVALIPTLLKKKIEQKIEGEVEKKAQ